MHYRALALVGRVIFQSHTGFDFHPVPVLVLIQIHALGHQTQELHVIFTADHGEPSGAVGTGILLGVAHEQLHVNGFPCPAVRVIHHVHIPDTVVIVRNVDHRLVQIKWTDLTVVVVLAVAIQIFQIDVRPAVHHPQIPLPQCGLQLIGAAVEHQQVGVGDFFHHDLAHVLGIGLKGIGVHKGHHLIEDPVGGQYLPVQPLHGPHAVVLNEDLLGFVLLFPFLALGAGESGLLVHRDHRHVVQCLLLVFQLALLAADQEGFVLTGEAVL